MTIDILSIMECMPHRYPFLLIDRVLDIELGSWIRAYKNVTMNEPFFQGHFPGYPVMPGVLILEAMAQAAGILTSKSVCGSSDKNLMLLVGVDGVRFKRQVLPGDCLTLLAKTTKQKGHVWKYDVEASVDSQLAAQAHILLSMQPREKTGY